MRDDLDRVEDPEVLAVIHQRWFHGSPHIGYAVLQGVQHDYDDDRIVFGLQAGPSIECSCLLHEMCHLVELPEARIIERNWGFRYGVARATSHGVDRFATTFQATLREARVWQWQHMLMQELGIPGSVEEIVRPAVFIHDFVNVPGKTDDQKLAYLADFVRKGAADLTIEQFDELWDDRVAKLPELFRQKREHFDKLDLVFTGECIAETHFRHADHDHGYAVVKRSWRNGDLVAHEVYMQFDGGGIDGGFTSFDEEKADLWAKRLFGEDEFTETVIKSLEEETAAPSF